MVKIIGIDKTKVKRVTCRRCASILEYTLSEVVSYKTNYGYLGDYDIEYGICCPVCKKNGKNTKVLK